MRNQKLTPFPLYLRNCRIEAGFQSLSAAVSAASKFRAKGVILSKAKLSQYERGVIDTIKPEVLRLLAATYQTPYKDLAERWFNDRYSIEHSKNSKIAISLPAHGELQITADDKQATLISLDILKDIQANVPKGTRVIVSTIRFLDDTIFFDMVLDNIKKGVIYYYLQPESQRPIYRNLLAKIEQALPDLRNNIDGQRTFFIPRIDFESPTNEVLITYPNGRVTGYIGLLGNDTPICYQILQDRLAMLLFNANLWVIRMATSAEVMREVKLLEGYYGSLTGENIDSPWQLIDSALAKF